MTTLKEMEKVIQRAKMIAAMVQGAIDKEIAQDEKHDAFAWALAFSMLAAAYISYLVAAERGDRALLVRQCDAMIDECSRTPWAKLEGKR